MARDCPYCGQAMETIGQKRLTAAEISRLPTGNQHSDAPTVIQWQTVKAAAEYYDVADWTAQIDRTLTYEENAELMRLKGSDGGRTMKELSHQR